MKHQCLILKDKIVANLAYRDEVWADVIAHTLTEAELNSDCSFCDIPYFELWTKDYVYSVANDSDNGDYITCVNRNPPNKKILTSAAIPTRISNMNKVIKVSDYGITFDNGWELYSNHDTDCCESHELYFRDLTLKDFEGLEFDLSGDAFFKRIDGFGIELIPVKGWSVRVAGHGCNNGYYSSDLTLILNGKDFRREFDITECQDIS